MPDHKPAHRPGCARPAPTEAMTSGGARILTCPGCGRFWWPDSRPRRMAPTVADALTAPTELEDTTPTSGYACRPHWRRVTWRGTGCPECAAELSRPRRRPRRAAPQAETWATS
ncbi:hypothetical protein FBY41_2623 [Humibacillus xanthopallidus]|uniref:Uncharacterized protein n=1 Tax=Humibacillus xanthopallidus TaxID=412689 RepID=A0A543HW72_9MICO|nr:hypothetical protein FBY41_2623 [Humibacillus xanthopallidus]